MARSRRLLASLAVVLFVVGFAFAPAWGDDKPAQPKKQRYTVDVTAKLDPAGVKAGESGKLVISFGTGEYRIEDVNLKWEPIAAQGVTYHTKKAALPKTDYTWVDKEWDEEHKYWTKNFELVIPFTLDKSLAPGTEVGAKIEYTACTSENCGPGRNNEVRIPIGRPAPKVSDPVEKTEGTVSVRLSDDGKAVIVRFEPAFGWFFYLPGTEGPGVPIDIKPREAEGVTWGKVEIPTGGKVEEPLEIPVPFEREAAAKAIEIDVSWAGCSSMGSCLDPRNERFGVAFAPEGGAAVVRKTDAPVAKRGDVAFPVVDTDDIGALEDEGDIAALIKEKGLAVALGLLFLIGAGLAFTPCVFPIIPLVVATIGGGGDVPRRRLAVLLGTYVLGLCMAFATMGLIAAFGGGSMSAAFASDAAQFAFVILFVLLAFGMLGLFELQPPQWLMKLQGGAQNRAGSVIGAFLLGILGAVLASPCTGPVIVGLMLFTADTGDAVLGFTLFFTLGLGMGAVFFAFGSLNFALRPGPWMVWVRYVFGMLLFGGAMYYLGLGELARGWAVALAVIACLCFAVLAIKSQHAKHSEEKARGRKWLGVMLSGFAIVILLQMSGLIPTTFWKVGHFDLLVIGLAVAAASAFAMYWHLHGKEGEQAPVARKRAVSVGVMYGAVLALVAFLTWPVQFDGKIEWTYVTSRAELVAEIDKAKAENKPALVDIWATTCFYCKEYDKVFVSDEELLKKFDQIHPIKVDLTKGELPAVRGALGVPPELRPVLVFFDREGRIRRNADVLGVWLGKGEDDEYAAAAQAVHKRLDLIINGGVAAPETEVGKQ